MAQCVRSSSRNPHGDPRITKGAHEKLLSSAANTTTSITIGLLNVHSNWQQSKVNLCRKNKKLGECRLLLAVFNLIENIRLFFFRRSDQTLTNKQVYLVCWVSNHVLLSVVCKKVLFLKRKARVNVFHIVYLIAVRMLPPGIFDGELNCNFEKKNLYTQLFCGKVNNITTVLMRLSNTTAWPFILSLQCKKRRWKKQQQKNCKGGTLVVPWGNINLTGIGLGVVNLSFGGLCCTRRNYRKRRVSFKTIKSI